MKKQNIIAYLVLSTSLLMACTQNSSGGGGRSNDPAYVQGRAGDCQDFIKSLPTDYFRDWIQVPENPEDPSGVQIKVFYYGKMTDPNNIVIFYNGGPGSDSHGNSSNFEEEMKKRSLTEKISFVYMDQRGTGCSDPYPQGHSDDILLRLRNYGSTGIVSDSEYLRKKLVGDKRWKVFGQSYGAFIVHRYAALHPESISEAYAHANTINANGLERLRNRIYSQYRVLEMYLQVYPGDRELLQDLKVGLAPEVCVGPAKDQYCGTEISENLVKWLGFSNRWPKLHKWVSAMVVDHRPQKNILQDYYQRYLAADNSGSSWAMSVIGYWDRNVVPTNLEYCSQVYDWLKQNGISEGQLLLNECQAGLQFKFNSNKYNQIRGFFQQKQDLLTLDQLQAGLLKMDPKSFHLYSGERDCFVPKETFSEELGVVKDLLKYTHFMNSGHEGFFTEDQVWQDLVSI